MRPLATEPFTKAVIRHSLAWLQACPRCKHEETVKLKNSEFNYNVHTQILITLIKSA